MKRFLTIMMAIIAFASSAKAQWSTKFHEGDELKGTSSYYSNLYVDQNGNAFICWDNDDDVKIVTSRGIFDYNDNYVFVIVGFYDGSSLSEKVSTYFYVPKGDSDTAYSSEYRKPGLGKKIKEHLKTTGDVRIIASKFSGSDFDIRIPMFKEMK